MRSNREQILGCFTNIQNGEGWNQKSFYESIGFTKILEDKEFIFFVKFFINCLNMLEYFLKSYCLKNQTA